MTASEPRYVVDDVREYIAPSEPGWAVFDYRTGRVARMADGSQARFTSRAKAYAWQREHQEPLERRDGDSDGPGPDRVRRDCRELLGGQGLPGDARLRRRARHGGRVMDRVTVLYNDLGSTDNGLPVEWPGVLDLARRQAAHYGLRFEVVRRELGGLWQQLRTERKKFPSSSARWCTSDRKPAQGMKLVTRLCAETGITDRPVRVLYCLGLRADESSGRARKQPLEVDRAHSSGRRTITRWLPTLPIDRPHPRIRGALPRGLRPGHGPTLSCSLCVLSSRADLVCAARLRPDLAVEYAALEAELGHMFQAGTSDGGHHR